MKNDITYQVTSFTVYPLDVEKWVLQTSKTINIIDNVLLVNVLKEVKNYKYITLKRLSLLIDNEIIFSKIIRYLEDSGIIRPLKKLNFSLQKSLLVTNNSDIFNFFQSHYFDKVILFKDVDTLEFSDNELIVAILNPYNPKMVDKLYDKVCSISSYLLLGFFYNFKFYLGNIYNSDLELPNHFDHLKYIQSGIYSEQTNYTYQDLVNIIFEKDPTFNLEAPLNWSDIVMVSRLILQRVIKIFDLDNNVNLYMNDVVIRVQEMNMKTYEIIDDFANYWEMG